MGETCSHVAAVLYKIEAAVRIGLTSTAPTDLPCQWNQTFTKSIIGSPVADIRLYSNSAKAKIKNKKTPSSITHSDGLSGFLSVINEVAPKTVSLSLFSSFQKNFVSKQINKHQMRLPECLRTFYSEDNKGLSADCYEQLV